jgi:hypothetical protein
MAANFEDEISAQMGEITTHNTAVLATGASRRTGDQNTRVGAGRGGKSVKSVRNQGTMPVIASSSCSEKERVAIGLCIRLAFTKQDALMGQHAKRSTRGRVSSHLRMTQWQMQHATKLLQVKQNQ